MCAYKAFVNGALSILLPALLASGITFAQDSRPFGKPKDTASSSENISGDSGKTPDKKPGEKKPTKVTIDPKEALDARLARAWKAFFAGKHSDSLQLADSLAKAQPAALALEARHLSARCSWAMGQTALDSVAEGDPKAAAAGKQQAEKYFAEARKIWKELSASTATANVKRQSIAAALELAAKDKSDEARGELDKVLSAEFADTCTCEAAILYAELRAQQGQIKDALRACKFATDFGGRLPAGNEITLATVRPFLDAAAALERKLKTEPAAAAFAAAEKLRQQKKFTQAIAAYENVAKDYPETDFAPRSRFSVGLCLVGLEKPADAIAYWKAFIKEEPSGPWRGQAYIAWIDADLEKLFDAEDAVTAAAAAEEAVKSADAKQESWRQARPDILMRCAMLAYVTDRFEDAARQASAALELVDKKQIEIRYGLTVTESSAKASIPTVPKEVRGGNRNAKLLLAVGIIYNLMARYERAIVYFDLVLAKNAGPVDNSKTAFAHYGRAISLHGRSIYDQAIAAYKTALETDRQASWQDKTLNGLAMAITHQAHDKQKKTFAAATHRKSLQTAEEQKKDAATRDQAVADFHKERAEAIPYWQELVRRYPKSHFLKAALYSSGMYAYEAGQTKRGLDELEKLVKDYPDCVYAGEALLILARHYLEQVMDQSAAADRLEKLDKWADAVRAAGTVTTEFSPGDPRYTPPGVLSKPKDGEKDRPVAVSFTGQENTERETYDIYMIEMACNCPWYLDQLQTNCALLRGFLYFVDDKKDLAKEQFDRLLKLDPEGIARQSAWGASKHSILIMAVDRGKMIAEPEEMKQYTGKLRATVMLCDFYYGMWYYKRGMAVLTKLQAGEYGLLTGLAKDYPQFLRGFYVSRLLGNASAVEEYMKVFKSPENLKGPNVSLAADRAGYCCASAAYMSRNDKLSELADKIWVIQMNSGRVNEWTLKARFNVAMGHYHQGDTELALKMLHEFPDSNPAMKEAAEMQIEIVKEHEEFRRVYGNGKKEK